MRKTTSVSDAIARPFLLLGNVACSALGSDEHGNLVRMLVNSLVWTIVGVVVVWIVA